MTDLREENERLREENEKLQEEVREMAMQCLSYLGQSQDAWGAKKAAEAENEKLRKVLTDFIARARAALKGD